jgi:hypothetical protein
MKKQAIIVYSTEMAYSIDVAGHEMGESNRLLFGIRKMEKEKLLLLGHQKR